MACFPKGSWSTANTSSLVRRFMVKGSNWFRSQPISKGAANRLHKVMWVYCSSGVKRVKCSAGPQPTQPITSMSGSFQRPGADDDEHFPWLKPMDDKLSQVS